jgi:hypothetical protein
VHAEYIYKGSALLVRLYIFIESLKVCSLHEPIATVVYEITYLLRKWVLMFFAAFMLKFSL